MSKLCVVVPEYRADTPTHFGYFIPFFDVIRQDFDLSIIAERGQNSFSHINPQYVLSIQRFHFFPLRAIEIFFLLFFIRLRGTKDFYVHYSFLAAFVASFIVRICGGRVFYWNCGMPWQYTRSRIRSFFERLVYRSITYFVTGTEGLAREYAAYYKIPIERIKVMPNWIDIEKIKNQKSNLKVSELRNNLRIGENQKVALFVHRLSKRKGAHYLPEIIRGFKDENVVFLIAGDGPERESLTLQVSSLKLENNVRFLGNIPNNQLPNYYSLADVFLMPSEEEGFPHVLLEAMASCVPFVAFDVGGVKEIAGPTLGRFVVSVGDVPRLSSEMRKILTAPQAELQTVMDAEAERVRIFDLPLVKQRFIELFT